MLFLMEQLDKTLGTYKTFFRNLRFCLFKLFPWIVKYFIVIHCPQLSIKYNCLTSVDASGCNKDKQSV